MPDVKIIHTKCGEAMTLVGVDRNECFGWYSAIFACAKCKTDVTIDEMQTQKSRKW